jgi:hypothetical protein
MQSRRAGLALLLLLLTPAQAVAAQLFVDDDPGCGQRAPCFDAVRVAVAAAQDGDEVVVLPGFYVENLVIEGKLLTLRAEAGPDQTTLDGSGGGTSVIRIDRGADVTVEGFTLQNGGGNASFAARGYGVSVGGIASARASIRENVIRNNVGWRLEPTQRTGGGGIGISSRARDFHVEVEISGNAILDNFRGIDLDQMLGPGGSISGSIRIVNNVIAFNQSGGQDPFDFGASGISLQTCCTVLPIEPASIDVLYNTVYGNRGPSGGGLSANASNLRVVGNVLFGNESDEGPADIALAQLSGNAAVVSNIIGDGSFDGEDGNRAVDPDLVDPAGGNFLPAPGSPALDAIPPGASGCGTDVDEDQRGVSRPQGLGCDVGAQEVVVALQVAADIKPGSGRNPVNLAGRGVLPVAILGSESLDVRDIDATTMTFGPAGARPAHKRAGHLRDVDRDGLRDLVSHFRTQESGLAPGDPEACVRGKTLDGTPFEACDAVTTVPRCGLGLELVLLVPVLRTRRRLLLGQLKNGTCKGN